MLKIEEIREIIQLIDESSISEFSYEHDGAQMTIKKPEASSQAPVSIPSPTLAAPSPQFTQPAEEKPAAPEPAVEEKSIATPVQEENITEIISPMVGTFYRKPSPDSDTFVEVGDTVKQDSIVCIVEAMKLFNEIESETAGEIVEILVSDGELVEYGQPLFKVKAK